MGGSPPGVVSCRQLLPGKQKSLPNASTFPVYSQSVRARVFSPTRNNTPHLMSTFPCGRRVDERVSCKTQYGQLVIAARR